MNYSWTDTKAATMQLTKQQRNFANFILSFLGFYLLATLGRAWTHGFNNSPSALYWAILLLLVLTLGALRFLSPVRKLSIALSIVAIGFWIFAIETSLEIRALYSVLQVRRSLHTLNQNLIAAQKEGAKIDYRTQLEVLRDLRAEGKNSAATFNSSLVWGEKEFENSQGAGKRLLPVGGISNRLTVFCNESGNYSFYQSDEHGFNNPSKLYFSGLDAMAVGDSFAHGACVPPEKSFVSLIRREVPKTLNVGWIGNGPLLDLASLREYGPALHPKNVFWFYCENDLADLNDEKKNPILLKYLDPTFSQSLISEQSKIDKVLENYLNNKSQELMEYLKAANTHVDYWSYFSGAFRLAEIHRLIGMSKKNGIGFNRTILRDFALFRQILDLASKETRSWGGRLVFVYIPGWETFESHQDPKFVNRYGIPNSDRERVLETARSLGIDVVDPTPYFMKDGDPLQYFPHRLFNHYNEKGQELISRAVLDYLKKK
jgi:hypothetical protein